MNNGLKSKMTKPQNGFGKVSEEDFAKAVFEKIMANSEEIGKMKLQPFHVDIVERCRALYKENERLFVDLIGALRT